MYEKKAARGARWLDRHVPGWHDRINIGMLDPTSNTNCVFGQVFGDFSATMDKMFFIPDWFSSSPKMLLLPNGWAGIFWAHRHGLIVLRSINDTAWKAAWQAEIEERKATHVPDHFPAEWDTRVHA